MHLPTEPIGSIPRPAELLEKIREFQAQRISAETLQKAYDQALRETIQCFEATGSPIITDGEQSKSSFVTYPLDGLSNIDNDGVVIHFADGHSRQLPKLTTPPFRYANTAGSFVSTAKQYTDKPLKQAVISASALSLLYPAEKIDGYSEQQFQDDLVKEAVADIRACLNAGAKSVQIDFTEGRLAVKLDPGKTLLRQFITLNNRVLQHFSLAERACIGIHSCPGGDHDSTHSAEVDYADFLPELFELQAGNFYLQLAGEKESERVLSLIKKHLKPGLRIFIGVIDVLNPEVEEPETVCQRVLQAAEFIPLAQLGTTDDCGFSPFEDDTSTGRETAFAKIRARVLGTQMAAGILTKKNGQ